MILAYLVHGPIRVVLDGFRLYCFVMGMALAGALVSYMRQLWGYTRAPLWHDSLRRYLRDWAHYNRRLLGRITLGIFSLFADISIVGTEVLLRWGHDMGYWRLPCNAIAVTAGTVALFLLMWWNNTSLSDAPSDSGWQGPPT